MGGDLSYGRVCAGVPGVLRIGYWGADRSCGRRFDSGYTTFEMDRTVSWILCCALCHRVMSTLAPSRMLRSQGGGGGPP